MKCLNVEYIADSYDLCDLEIDGGSHNYVAEGIVVHNTWTCLGFHKELNNPELLRGNVIITSKGLSHDGLAFKYNEKNQHNLYIRALQTTANEYGDVLERIAEYVDDPIYILGETFGTVQTGFSYGVKDIAFRVFDVYVGTPGRGKYLNWKELCDFCYLYGLDQVPVLYMGPYSKDVVDLHTDGKETISGNSVHMREGLVIKPLVERYDFAYVDDYIITGRVMLKSVSADYILRKGNVTEYT